MRCALEFDFHDVVVAADGTSYASLADGCTAEECHSRLGDRGPDEHRADDVRALGTVTDAPLSRLRGQMRREEQS